MGLPSANFFLVFFFVGAQITLYTRGQIYVSRIVQLF